MFSKWRIRGIDNYIFGEDKKLYKMSYVDKAGNIQATKEVKKQYPNRYKVNGRWLSERQMKNRLEIDQNPIELFRDLPDYPF